MGGGGREGGVCAMRARLQLGAVSSSPGPLWQTAGVAWRVVRRRDQVITGHLSTMIAAAAAA